MKTFKQFLRELKLSEGKHDKSSFKAIFLCGSPGSGKSFVSKHVLADGKAHGLKYINSDQAFEYLLQKAHEETGDDKFLPKNLQYTADDPDVKNKRSKALDITTNPYRSSKYGLGIKERLGLLIDGTGADEQRIAKEKSMLEDLGYETYMVYVNIDLETALKRNQQRTRRVPQSIILQKYRAVTRNKNYYRNLFGNNFLYIDNRKVVNDPDSYFLKYYRKILKFLETPAQTPQAREFFNS